MRRELRAQVDGGEVRGWIDGQGAHVLALHGGPGLSYGYLDEMVLELAGGFEVATYQQRGLEPSTTDGPFSLDQEVRDLLAVLDALEWDRALLVGHSWGGHLALHVALRHPERVRGVVAVDPLGAVGDGGRDAMVARFDAFRAATEDDPVLAGRTGLARVWPAYFADPKSAPPMPPVQSNPASYEGIFSSIQAAMPGLAAELPRCEVPFVFLAGERSPLEPSASSQPTAALLPNASLELVVGAGHFPWHEEPGCVRRALEGLVRGS